MNDFGRTVPNVEKYSPLSGAGKRDEPLRTSAWEANTAADQIGNGVISLLCQLRCHCNPDLNKFSSLPYIA